MTPQTLLLSLNAACTLVLGVLLFLIKGELSGLRRAIPTVPAITVEGGTATGNSVTVHQGADAASNRTWLNSREVAEKEGVDPRTVLQWIENGDLPAEKVGKEWRIDPAYTPPN